MSKRFERMVLAATIVSVGMAASPDRARAWGDEGHKIVALIADHYLVPSAKAQVNALLAADSDTLTPHDIASEATWADKYRDSDRATTKERYNQTNKWHFIDLELEHPDLDAACYGHPRIPRGAPATSGPAEDCIVDKIDEFARELAAKGTPPEERLLALKFLLHFIGDLHQPLHSSDNHDMGGNQVHVVEDGVPPGTLHHYWDTEFVSQLGADPREVAEKLIADISPAELRDWSGGAPAAWATQAFGLAREHVYAPLDSADPQGAYRLRTVIYGLNAEAVAELQLSRAGVRLAALLNRALGLHKITIPQAHR